MPGGCSLCQLFGRLRPASQTEHRTVLGWHLRPGSRQVSRALWRCGPKTPPLGLVPLTVSVAIPGPVPGGHGDVRGLGRTEGADRRPLDEWVVQGTLGSDPQPPGGVGCRLVMTGAPQLMRALCECFRGRERDLELGQRHCSLGPLAWPLWVFPGWPRG